jgi:hypothetical protein
MNVIPICKNFMPGLLSTNSLLLYEPIKQNWLAPQMVVELNQQDAKVQPLTAPNFISQLSE